MQVKVKLILYYSKVHEYFHVAHLHEKHLLQLICKDDAAHCFAVYYLQEFGENTIIDWAIGRCKPLTGSLVCLAPIGPKINYVPLLFLYLISLP